MGPDNLDLNPSTAPFVFLTTYEEKSNEIWAMQVLNARTTYMQNLYKLYTTKKKNYHATQVEGVLSINGIFYLSFLSEA